MEDQKPPQSIGELRVRTTFNPSTLGVVDAIKQKSAELINLISDLPQTFTEAGKNGELARLKALALTNIENGAMWGVKAATV